MNTVEYYVYPVWSGHEEYEAKTFEPISKTFELGKLMYGLSDEELMDRFEVEVVFASDFTLKVGTGYLDGKEVIVFRRLDS